MTARSKPRPWILGPGQDLAFFLFTPFLILALAWAFRDMAALGAIAGLLLAVMATGHHLPGFIRAYCDPELFHRYRKRFLFAPVLFLGVCTIFAIQDFHGLDLILLVWGGWHGAMQVHGFIRIYDAKVGGDSLWTSRLDFAMCLLWFGSGFLHSESKLHLMGLSLFRAGLDMPPAQGLIVFRLIWDGLTAMITAVFILHAMIRLREGHAANPLKYMVMATSFGFWWFCMVHIQTPLLGVLLFEILHDIQYNALVWTYQTKRVDQGLSTSPLERFLFRPIPIRMLVYASLILLYGCLGIAANYAGLSVPGRMPGSDGLGYIAHLFLASAFLHFYFDGFIWKVREKDFRRNLGLQSEDAKSLAAEVIKRPRPYLASLSPLLKWSLFILPVSVLAYTEWQARLVSPLDFHRNIAPLLPRNWQVRHTLGQLELEAGLHADAAIDLEKAEILNPSLGLNPKILGDLYRKAGQNAKAIDRYRQALILHPEDMTLHYDLGLLLRKEGRVAEAIPELRLVADEYPSHEGTNYSAGLALWMEKRESEALPYFRNCATSQPKHKQAWFYLGLILENQKQFTGAAACFRKSVEIDSNFKEAKMHLIEAEKNGHASSLGASTKS